MNTRYIIVFVDLGYNDEYYSIGSGYDLDPRPLRETYATLEEAEKVATQKSFDYIMKNFSGRYALSIVDLCGEDGPESDLYPDDIIDSLYDGEEMHYYNAPTWEAADAKCREVFGVSLVEKFPQDIPKLHTVHEVDVP